MFATSFFLSHSNLARIRSRSIADSSIFCYRYFYGLSDLRFLIEKRAGRRLSQRHSDVFANSHTNRGSRSRQRLLVQVEAQTSRAPNLGSRKGHWQSSKLAKDKFCGECSPLRFSPDEC